MSRKQVSLPKQSGKARVQVHLLFLRPCLLSAPHRAFAPLDWKFDSVVLGAWPPPTWVPRWHEPGLSFHPAEPRGFPGGPHEASVPSRGPGFLTCHPSVPATSSFFSVTLRTMNEAGWFLPSGPHLLLLPRQDGSLFLGGSIFWFSQCLRGHGLQGGAREALYGQKRPSVALCLPSCCAHLECATPPTVHTWRGAPPACCVHT